MPKTIAVVDEQGRIYEATYPKRARGLVKKGRARFLSENVICLACPPDMQHDSEEKRMSNTVTIEQIFEQINKVVESTAFFERAIHTLAAMTSADIPTDSYAPGDIAGQARAQAVADICRSRETTNQQLLRFYEKMYDDLMYMQGLRRESTPVGVKPFINKSANLPEIPPLPHVPQVPPIPDIPDVPEMPDIPMVPPV